MRFRPLPRSKFVKLFVHNEKTRYAPAKLDINALERGILKYKIKEHRTFSIREYRLVLMWMTRLFGPMLDVPMWSADQSIEEIDESKAAGTPFEYIYGNLKKFVLNKLTFADLLYNFVNYDQVHVATLKDELRPIGKAARMFVPANIVLIAVGNWLFGAQNASMIDSHTESNIKVGMSAPGSEAFLLWLRIRSWTGYCYDADGDGWDANLNMCLLALVRDLRKQFIPSEYHHLVDRYYSQVHNGWTSAVGYLFNLQGQISGQTNTTADNSLCHAAIMCLHAIRNNMTFHDFREQVEWYVVGDDLIYNSKTELFTVENLQTTWNSLGMYIESSGNTNPDELTFVGMHPCDREYHRLYSFRGDKNLASMNYHDKKATYAQILSSLVNLTMGVFADKPLFERMRAYTKKYMDEHKSDLTDIDKQLFYLLNDYSMLRQYTGVE